MIRARGLRFICIQNLIDEDIEIIYSPPIRWGGSRPMRQGAEVLETGWWNFTREIS